MADIDNISNKIQTDARIASILQKLRDADEKDKSSKKKNDKETDTGNVESKEDDTEKSVQEPRVQEPRVQELANSDKIVNQMKDVVDQKIHNDLTSNNFVDNIVLPWFTPEDRDTEYLHYMKLDGDGSTTYSSVKLNKPLNDIASLKLKKDYLCDIDYYKSNHYVLLVERIMSDYNVNNTLMVSSDETELTVNDIEINATEIIDSDDSISATTSIESPKVNTNEYSQMVMKLAQYVRYIVFTDYGIADFVVKSTNVIQPTFNTDLNKWFEEISNYSLLKNTEFTPTCTSEIQNDINNIRDYKYDIITMHRPGIITLDSVDNNDSNYQVNLKLKDEFSFLPIDRILSCLKQYATNDNKSIDDLRFFINYYFDVIIP